MEALRSAPPTGMYDEDLVRQMCLCFGGRLNVSRQNFPPNSMSPLNFQTRKRKGSVLERSSRKSK